VGDVCGIAGILDPSGPVGEDELKRLGGELVHRGPDDQGWVANGRVGLAATRLAIVDLSAAGSQPMVEGRQALVFNGEVYNQAELRRELENDGVTFRGHSDTEVLFRHLLRHGVEATLPRLRGMFAFAWSDGERVWLARDRFGIKPLVWARSGRRVLWASEARALRAEVDLRPDPTHALFGFLSLADQSGRRTVFAGVEQVPPGTVALVGLDGHVEVRRWHSMAGEVDEAYFRELDNLDFEAVTDRLDALLSGAVERMLMGDAPTGTFVSGGVDSALLAALATPRSTDHVLFAADVSRPRSEAGAARRVANLLGRDLRLTRFEPADLLDHWAPATLAYEAPLVTHMNSLPYGAVAALARSAEVKSVLTGEGADELFFGYAETAFRPFRTLLRSPVLAVARLYGTVPGLAKRVLPELRDARERQLADVTEDFERVRHEAEALDAYAFLGPRDARRHAAGLEMLGGHLLSLLHRNDRMGMAASVESRFPYLDEEVVRLALNLPIRAKLRWGARLHDHKHPFLRDKAVLRAVAARHLPPDVALRPKDGFPSVGHEHLTVSPGFFRDGWLAEVLHWSRDGIDRLCTVEPPVIAARLASVEVFGRLFARDEAAAAVTAHLHRNVVVHA
jgi:asparagine synthase (glutamine-hydrolysing)